MTIGTIVGAGIFGLPALFSSVGWAAGTILFWLLALIVLATHLLYVEVILASKKRQRLVGYARSTFGNAGFVVGVVTYPLQIVGVNFAYILLGGEFLDAIMQRAGVVLPLLFWQMIFWLMGALVVFVGFKRAAKVEAAATWLLIASMVIVILVAGRLDMPLPTASFDGFRQWLAPFGVFLFALSGLSGISETIDVVGRDRLLAYRAVAVGTIASAFLSWLFGIIIALLAEGRPLQTPGDIMAVLPAQWAMIIPVVGFLAVVTSYIATSEDLTAALRLDFKFKGTVSWALAVFLPFCLLFLTHRDFLATIDFVGGIFSAVNGILVAAIAHRVLCEKKHYGRWFAFLTFLVLCAYLIGIVHKILYR